MTKVIFLIEKDSDNEVFAFFNEEMHNWIGLNKPNFYSYSHIGQHSSCSVEYANECKEAEYYQYQDLLKELISIGYKDLQVLNSQEIELHRKPAAFEIKLGYGATFYRNFKLSNILNKQGNIKKWISSPDDNLRYYY
jgi:hypothetical protein